MAGYTRQSIADIINGAEITAPPLNAEFNQLSAAFNAATGHSHDGTSGNSPKINLATSVAGYLPAAHGGVGGLNNTTATTNPLVTDDSTQGYAPGSIWENTTTGRIFICVGNASGAAVWRELVQVQTGNVIFPEVNDTVDLGTVTNRFQDLFLSGGIAASGNTSLGGTLNVTGSTALSSTLAVTGLSTMATVDINGGNIDGTVIGAATRAAGNFTTASTTGLATLASADINGGTIDGAVIGGASPSTVTGTNITANTGFSGPLTGSVTGNVTGNLTGNVTGNVTGNLTGNVTSAGTSTFQNVTINGTLDMNAGTASTVTGLSAPVNGTDATTKTYVDAADATKLNLSGGTMTGAVAMGNNRITGLGTPVNAADAATKGYVDTSVSNLIDAAPGALDTLNELAAALGDDPNFSTTITNSIATKLPLAGGTMTGDITLGANKATSTATPTANDDLTRKGYVDTQVGTRLPLAGGTMTGAIAMGNSKITGLGTPTAGTDATTKTYVDGVDATKLNLSGGTMTGGIVMGANKITSTATPTVADDLTRKGYVDGILGSATAAADSAAAASSSATSSANSASAALTSEGNAAQSETNAANSAAAALISEQNAASSAASINPNNIDINGGTIDGTVIGGSVPAGGFFTATTVIGATSNTVVSNGVISSNRPDGMYIIQTANAPLLFDTNNIERVSIEGNGDVNFYEPTGNTPKLTWGSSAGSLSFADNVKATFGAGSDLEIYHDGTNSVIKDAGTGILAIGGDSEVYIGNAALTEAKARFLTDGTVQLFHDNALKFATTATGINVVGTVATNNIITTTADINGGTIDGTVIGGSTPAAISGTTGVFGVTSLSASNSYGTPSLGTGSATAFSAFHVEAHSSSGFSEGPYLGLMRSGGTQASPTNLVSGDFIGVLTGQAFQTAGSFPYRSSAEIRMVADAAHSSTSLPSRIEFLTTAASNITPTERMRIDSSGVLNVSMTGTETSTINGFQFLSTAGTGGLTIYSSSAGPRDQIQLKDSVTTGPASGNTCALGVSLGALYLKTGGSERLRITSAGNVGIGTSSPTGDGATLHINGSTANSTLHLTNTTTGSGAADGTYVTTSGNDFLLRNREAGNMLFFTDNATRMTITSTGNVGIGTSSPSQKLHVSGGIASTGQVPALTASSAFFDYNTTLNIARFAAVGNTTGAAAPITFSQYSSNGSVGRDAVLIDASGNLLVGKTVSDNTASVGIEIQPDSIRATRTSNPVAFFNRRTTDGDIVRFLKDSTTVGSIGVAQGRVHLVDDAFGGVSPNSIANALVPVSNDGNASNGELDLGLSGSRFKDLYLSGGVYLGGTGSANLLDDYEEGTWTATVGCTSNATTTTTVTGYYTKVGRQVTVAFRNLNNIDTTGLGGFFTITLPFAVNSGSTFGAVGSSVWDTLTYPAGYTHISPSVSTNSSAMAFSFTGSAVGDGLLGATAPSSGTTDLATLTLTYFTT